MMKKPFFSSNITENDSASDTLTSDRKIGTFCSCFYTQKSRRVVYFTHGFLQKKGGGNDIGSSLSRIKAV